MANIENYKIFRKLKDPTRENVLYMIYRAERLYAAMAHAEKIFNHGFQELDAWLGGEQTPQIGLVTLNKSKLAPAVSAT